MSEKNLIQGSPEWHAHRASSYNASEASAMLNISPHKSRSDLLKLKATGIAPEVSDAQQEIFDRGHAYEAIARPWAEEIIGEELYPATHAKDIDGMPLSASTDGVTLMGNIAFEHKSLNNKLREALRGGVIPGEYHPQLEQVLLLSGAEKCLFMASSGNRDDMLFAWYESVPELRKKLIAGWKQFAKDLAEYQHQETPTPVAGRAPDQLPALHIEVTGMVTASNLDAFKSHALAVFDGIKTDLETDEDFADAERTVRWCRDVEDRLEAAKQNALSQTASIDELFRAIDDIREEARQKRLTLDKLVKTRKDSIRIDLVREYHDKLTQHVDALNRRLGGPWVLAVPFGDVIKGKKSIKGSRDALDAELAQQKIAANELADRIEANRKAIGDNWFLFQHDFARVCHYDPDALAGLITQRVAAEQQRIDAQKLREEQAALAKAAVKHEEQRIVEATTPTPVKASVVAAKLRAQIVAELDDLSESQLLKVIEAVAAIRGGMDKKAA